MQDSEPISTPLTRDADRAQLAQLDAEIHKLQLALSALYAERKPVQDRLDSYIYPVMTLPNEYSSSISQSILRARLFWGMARRQNWPKFAVAGEEIALATPALWRAIELFEDDRGGRSLDVQIAIMQTWLKRSGSLPLSILLRDNMPHTHSRQRAIAGALDDLLDHRARWEYVLLSLPDKYDSRYSHRFQGPMPLLLELELRYGSQFRLDVVLGRLNAPKLGVALIPFFAMAPWQLISCIPLAQLTRLQLQSLHPVTAIAILRETKNLVDCRLALMDHRVSSNSNTITVVHLPRLEILILQSGFTSISRSVEFLHALRAPNLRQLCIEAPLYSDDPVLLSAILQSMGCNLQLLNLFISQTKTSLDQYQAALPNVPDLHHGFPTFQGWDLVELYGSRQKIRQYQGI
ncbi:hypothetical protein C8F01DRAFT_1360708 [Mycena amicta]|nr:hypothetical protein C8F01DRAFT_1360708 [Mycena amicta]